MEKEEFVKKSDLDAIVEKITSSFEEKLADRKKKFELTGDPVDKAKVKELGKWASTVKYLNAMSEGDRRTLKDIHAEVAKQVKYQNETTGSAGAYLVPVEFEKSIIKYMEQYSQIRSNATILTMNSKTKNLNSLVGEPTVYITSEGNKASGSALTFGEPILTARKYVGIVDWSSEVIEDSEIDLINTIAERIGRAIAKKEQSEFINGVVSGSEGILQVSGVTAKALASGTSFTNITWDDLANMVAALGEVDEDDLMDAKFFMSHSVYNVLRKQKASTTGEYYLPVAPTMKDPAMAWGYPIVVCNQMPKVSDDASGAKFVALANGKRHFFIGDRRGITMKLLTEGTVGSNNLAEQDMEALRVTKRTAFTTALQDGIVTLATN